MYIYIYIYIYICVCVCVCVCVCCVRASMRDMYNVMTRAYLYSAYVPDSDGQRDKTTFTTRDERDRQRDRKTERQTDREIIHHVHVHGWVRLASSLLVSRSVSVLHASCVKRIEVMYCELYLLP